MKRLDRARRFHLRLLAAFGAGLLPGLIVDRVSAGTMACISPDEADACISESFEDAVIMRIEDEGASECPVVTVDGPPTRTGDDCCYPVTTDCEYGDDFDCGCYGRPFVDAAGPVTAQTRCSDDWLLEGLAPSLDGLSPAERSALAEFWTANALAEHSSVAGFHRFALDLMAHGAPMRLIARTQEAAAEELRHALICFSLASAYTGRDIGPTVMPLGDSARIATTLLELAVGTAREGCIGETGAAWLACEMAERAADPTVRRALAVIAADEAAHAELAWEVLRWAIDTGGDEIRRAVARVFAAAAPSVAPATAAAVPEHGLLDAHEGSVIRRLGFDAIVRPCAHRLLAG